MDLHTKKHIKSITALMGVLTLIALSSTYQSRHGKQVSNISDGWTARIGSTRSFSRLQRQRYPDQPEYRVAQRLQQRLRKRGHRAAPSLGVLAQAVESRQKLLGKYVDVTFATEEDEAHSTWNVSAQKYPLWVSPSFTMSDAKFVMNTGEIAKTFEREEVLSVEPPVHAILRNVQWKEHDKTASRAEIEGAAKSGYLPDGQLIANSIAKAFVSDLSEITIPLKKEDARIINMTGEDMGNLALWATGRSNYKGSTYARRHNVEKALSEHVDNTIVAPGETFSFNSTLDGPVSVSNGWSMAKVIFNGGDLKPAPGGGICQASTTVFRAVVNAGFPVVERRAHSLYVSYYKKHGVGIDATIYPGSQDLVFLNDSESPIIIQARNDGDEAIVNIFGSPDGRTVELEGPYFASTAPEGFTYRGRKISNKEIVWKQRVVYPGGGEKTYEIGSRYKELPSFVANEYDKPEITVHASAPVASLQ